MRRTDKVGTEASFHPVEEYIRGVDDFFRLHHEMNNDRLTTKRGRPSIHPTSSNYTQNVYLASDDVKVLTEARTK